MFHGIPGVSALLGAGTSTLPCETAGPEVTLESCRSAEVRVLAAEDPGDEFAPASHANLVEDRLEVVLHGVFGDEQRDRDLLRRIAEENQPGHLGFPRCEPVRLQDEPCQV